jgi:hypothetical protein
LVAEDVILMLEDLQLLNTIEMALKTPATRILQA